MFSVSDPPGPPEAPEIAEFSSTHVTVTWQPPENDGGSPVTGYHIERRVTNSQRWVKVNKDAAVTELTFTDKEVIEDNEYEYRIMAENKVGVGPPSSPSQPVTAKDPFGKK